MLQLYEWQRDAIEKITDKNCIISAPTGAGKTKVAYLWADLQGAILKKKHKVFYTAPIKALANEKYWELSQLYGEQNVGLQTGDASINAGAPILICTQEIYTKAYRNKNITAKVVIDEFHYIFTDNGRSRAYIDGIQTPHPTLVMSATFGEPAKIARYIEGLTGKKFVVYETDFRPTKLVFSDKLYTIDDLGGMGAVLIYIFNTRTAKTLARAIAQRRTSQPARRIKITRIANKYKVNLANFDTLSTGVAVYHGRLQYNEKLFVEECVRKRLVDVLVATSALGVGVNLPIETALFAGFVIPTNVDQPRPLTKIEFLQMAGRAGRPGFFETGIVGVLTHGLSWWEDRKDLLIRWETLIGKAIETPQIKLSIDIERILLGTPIEQELEYVVKNSLPPIEDEEEITAIKEELERIEKTISELPQAVFDTLKNIYTSELELEENIKLAKTTLRRKFVVEVEDIRSFCKDDRGDYYSLLKTYRVGKHLKRKGVQITDFDTIVRAIQAIDPWIFVKQQQEGEGGILL